MPIFIRVITEHILLISPLIASSCICAIISIERSIAFLFSYPLDHFNEFFDRIQTLILKERMSEALALCERFKTKPVARTVKEALLRAHQPQEQIKYGLEISIAKHTEKIKSRTHLIFMTSILSLLLGAFITLVEFMHSIEISKSIDPTLKFDFLIESVGRSLTFAVLGLVVATPGFMAYIYLVHKTTILKSKLNESSLRIQDILQQRYFDTESVHPSEEPTITGHVLETKIRNVI